MKTKIEKEIETLLDTWECKIEELFLEVLKERVEGRDDCPSQLLPCGKMWEDQIESAVESSYDAYGNLSEIYDMLYRQADEYIIKLQNFDWKEYWYAP